MEERLGRAALLGWLIVCSLVPALARRWLGNKTAISFCSLPAFPSVRFEMMLRRTFVTKLACVMEFSTSLDDSGNTPY